MPPIHNLKPQGPTIRVTRLDAARRQLATAIELWFADGDPVSVHTLVCAAHQVIHDLNRKEKGRPLLFDAQEFKQERRKEVIEQFKRHQNFFKHADLRRGDATAQIDFDPTLSEVFFLASILRLQALGYSLTDVENAFLGFRMMTGDDALAQHGQNVLSSVFNREELGELRGFEKREFFQSFLAIRATQRRA